MDRYEEALERAKEWEREHPNGYLIRDMMEHIFPGYNDSEDERTRKELIHFILYKAGQLLDEETEHKFVAYLEKQREQKSAEWSEEDEKMLAKMMFCFKSMVFPSSEECNEFINWLKSFHPQPHWKPSEEQMECLQGAIEEAESEGLHGLQQGLIDLMESLKRL